ncbi:hypothetical protein [Flavobacterium sp. NRK1]|jgi:hypothetical protein|uniref:hypothetical protein n=1 Tax=Flavobacterium sp. NRK1 TaxID=2954929 RepID=UPI0020934437|nr:hypothetical protein [Flavobacterium sp. NRK1]MCO6148448.1 hypothetical protein [Flavobacterium sp. NRK1]
MRLSISYDSLQEYILEHDLTENDAIVLHPRDYDAVASEYATENNIMIYRSFEILGVPVLEDTADEVKKNNIYVMPLAAS